MTDFQSVQLIVWNKICIQIPVISRSQIVKRMAGETSPGSGDHTDCIFEISAMLARLVLFALTLDKVLLLLPTISKFHRASVYVYN